MVVSKGNCDIIWSCPCNVESARLLKEIRYKLWAECANVANDMENMCLHWGGTDPPYTIYFGKEPKNFWHIRHFGEIGIAKKGPDIQSKMANPGIAVMYLGHAKEHGREVYRLLNIETKRVMMSRDVRWLDINYTSYKKQQGLWDESEDH